MLTNDQTIESRQKAKDLLLKDYQYRSESLWKNEQSGETRINLFVGLVTIVIGALVTLTTAENTLEGETLRLVALATLLGLVLLGTITLMRMLTRNEHTDKCKQGLDMIRQVFKDFFDEDGILVQYYPIEGPIKKQRRRRKLYLRKFGGLVHTVAAINSFLFSAITAISVYPIGNDGKAAPDLVWVYGSAVSAFIVGFLIQVWYIFSRESNSKKEIHANDPTHAGGVVCRTQDGSAKYLLVRPKNQQDQWVLPKGHIMYGEGHGEAAIREVREETGVAGRLVCLVSRVEFETNRGHVDAKFYLMEYVCDVEPDELRDKNWCTIDEALQENIHPETKYILIEADRRRPR